MEETRDWKRKRSSLSCYKFITLFIAYPPPCLGFYEFPFSCDYSFSYSPSLLYLISTVQVFHGTLGNLIWLSSIQIHGIFSTLCFSPIPSRPFWGGTMAWLLGLEASEKSIPSTMVWGSFHKLRWRIFNRLTTVNSVFIKSMYMRNVTFKSLKRSWKKDQGHLFWSTGSNGIMFRLFWVTVAW